MSMVTPINTEIAECQDCYKCIRQCPVKAIRVEDGHAKIIPDLCMYCGRCVINCPAKAKHVRDDLPRVKQLLTLKNKVIVSLAPSFISEFPQVKPDQMIGALKKLGFFGVSETAIGADLVSAQVAQDLTQAAKKLQAGEATQKLFLSSACPSSVEYIKRYLPEYEPYITDRASPLLTHARFLREQFGDGIGVVFIGPCIAKKRESDEWKEIDTALTFNDLRRWFESEHIQLENFTMQEEFIPLRAGKGTLYPIDGGMIESCKKYSTLENVRTMAIAGIDEIARAFSGLNNDTLREILFIELLSCSGGCINGPGAKTEHATVLKRVNVVDYANAAQDTICVAVGNIKNTLTVLPSLRKLPSEDEIRSALRSIGKYIQSDELNCASCGYDTCRSFCRAMIENRAEKTMCVSYMRKLAQKKANGLIQAIPSGVVIVNKNLQIVECNRNFARLMGSELEEMYEAKPGLEGADFQKIADFSRFFADVLELNGPDVIEREVHEGKKVFSVSVFVIEKEEIAGGVIQDITDPQVRKNRVVNQAKRVINKNLSVVQKIAFLLGENAAETESMLNSIIESFGEDENTGK